MTEHDLPDKPCITGPVTIDAKGNLTGIAGGWQAVKIAQKVFQQKHCYYCIHYDFIKNDFKTKGHPNDPENCEHHWTDIMGTCWNYKPRY